MRKWLAPVLALVLAVGPTTAALSGPTVAPEIIVLATGARWPGRIFVSHDFAPVSDGGFAEAPVAARQFAINIGNVFAKGRPGKFLAYSQVWSTHGNEFGRAMREAGHTWTQVTDGPFRMPDLLAYDGVFVSAVDVDNAELIDYVRAGGNVFVAGGAGYGGAAVEAMLWNGFLQAFGLRFESQYNLIYGFTPVLASPSPYFAGVGQLWQNNGQSVSKVVQNDPDALILYSYYGQGLFAAYASGAIPVHVSVAPYRCPNQINVRSGSPLRVAVIGTSEIDVTTINASLVRLLGVPASAWTLTDVGTPSGRPIGKTTAADCDLNTQDGRADLVLSFDKAAVTKAITAVLGRPPVPGEYFAITLTGARTTAGAAPIVGEDIIVIQEPSSGL